VLVLRWLHAVGSALFLGGALAAVLAHRVGQRPEAKGAAVVTAQLWNLVHVALLILLSSGLATIAAVPGPWMKQGFIHVMLTSFVVASAAAGIAGKRARLLAQGAADDVASARARVTIGGYVAVIAGLVAIAAGVFRF
jgi:hypothetical protein